MLISICTFSFSHAAGASHFVHLMIYLHMRKHPNQGQFKFCLLPAITTCFNLCGTVIIWVCLKIGVPKMECPKALFFCQHLEAWGTPFRDLPICFCCVVGFLMRLDRGAGNFYIMKTDPKLIDVINKTHDDNLKACICQVLLLSNTCTTLQN